MQSIMSAFKRSSDKKHKRLLEDSLVSSTDVSFTNDENARPQTSFSRRADSLKPQQILHTPSPSKFRREVTVATTNDNALQDLGNHMSLDQVTKLLVCQHAYPLAACQLHPLSKLSPNAASLVPKGGVISPGCITKTQHPLVYDKANQEAPRNPQT